MNNQRDICFILIASIIRFLLISYNTTNVIIDNIPLLKTVSNLYKPQRCTKM
jgi:hypothetical protein